MARDRHRAAWEDWGRIDPFWAILTEADARHGRWDVDRFFATGIEQVATMLAHTQHYGRPARRGTALDFGCGVGRLTRALAPHFERTYGLDVASTMIDRARRLDRAFGPSGAVFVRHDREDLSRYASGSVDFLVCVLVLQHLPSREAIEGYLREFVRVLSPGGVAVVQLPVHVPPADDDQYVRLRTRGARLLRAVGVSPRLLYGRLGWEPEMLMSGIPYDETVTIFEASCGRLLDTAPENAHPGGVMSRTYFVAPRDGGELNAAAAAHDGYESQRSGQGSVHMDRLIEERIALNNATFRNANERISAAAGVYDVDMPVPFICECADRSCSEILRLELDKYEEIRADSRHFLNAPGHHAAAQGAAVVVAERDGYVIVEKVGRAGDIVEALDERKPEEGLEQLAASEE